MKAKDSKAKLTQLDRAHQKLTAYLWQYRSRADEVFRFTDPEVRDKALENVKALDLHEATRLLDRFIYLTRTRIVRTKREIVRCTGKAIYDLNGAKAQAKVIWHKGRGKMRIYLCPRCSGHHLTHIAHRDSHSERLAA